MELSLWQVITGALALDRATFEAIQLADHGLRTALVVMLLAGASETLGQSVVLFLNRVSRRRFALALFLGGLALVLEALLWIASTWLVVVALGVPHASFLSTVRVLGLAYAPLILGVLGFLPYIGLLIERVLRVWVLLAAVVGTSVAFGLAPPAAALAAALGFLGRWLLLRLLGGVSDRASQWLWRASTGRATPMLSADGVYPLEPRIIDRDS